MQENIVCLEKVSLITSEECIESNVIPIEAVQFLQEATAAEALNNASAGPDQDGDDEEDLVCVLRILSSSGRFLLILVRSDLEQTPLGYSRELSRLFYFLLGNDHLCVCLPMTFSFLIVTMF